MIYFQIASENFYLKKDFLGRIYFQTEKKTILLMAKRFHRNDLLPGSREKLFD